VPEGEVGRGAGPHGVCRFDVLSGTHRAPQRPDRSKRRDLMVSTNIGGTAGSLAVVLRQRQWWRLPARFWSVRRPAQQTGSDDQAERHHRFRYHLGRGRRAREAGRFEHGAAEARKAVALNPGDPWALALLGQCLQQQRATDLDGARRAFERAWALDPTNGYFVGLLLGVLSAQGDVEASRNLLEWAWWRGAPVERWLPGGPPMPSPERRTAYAEPAARDARIASRREPPARRSSGSGLRVAGRHPIPA
jgi:tetratricopeptide (TPR) repeat protein